MVQVAAGPRGIDVLLENAGGRDIARQFRDKADHFRAQLIDGHRSPTRIVMPPHAHTLTGLLSRDEAGEDRFFGIGGRDRHGINSACFSSLRKINSPPVRAGGFIIVARAFSQVEETMQAPAHLFLGSYQNAQTAHLPARKVIYGCLVRRISATEAC